MGLSVEKGARVLALLAAGLLAACGGGGGSAPAGTGPGAQQPPPPAPDPLSIEIAAAISAIQADPCGRAPTPADCVWVERAYRPAEFSMAHGTGEALLVIDSFPSLPVQAIRFRKRIKGYYRPVPGGIGVASGSWRVPAVLWDVLDRFAQPTQVAAHRLRDVSRAAARYDALPLDTVGHGSFVFGLLADPNPNQPLVLMDSLKLHVMNRADFCDTSGRPDVQERLLRTAAQAAADLKGVIEAENVRFINYSAGHSLPQLAGDWAATCGTAAPPDTVLRAKLAAYAPLYAVLFATPGVMTAHASAQASTAADYPYDQASPDYPNRLRVGFFSSLASGLDAQGRGSYAGQGAWPSAGNADIYLNTGVLPQRPYDFNQTPLLQLDRYGLDAYPITAPQPSWMAPLAVSRMINLRYGEFAGRTLDDKLIAELFARAVPAACPDQPQQRCRYQDPLLHGQIESVRLQFRPRIYTP